MTAGTKPDPVVGDNGSGMHAHRSIWKDGKPLFAGDGYASLSDDCLFYIGGIENKIHPGEPMDKDLYDLPAGELKDIPTVCGSLRETVEALDSDRVFLKKGGVMSDDQIDASIDLKMEEVIRFEQAPHPVEYDMYYSV